MPLKWNERPKEKEKIRKAPGQREESSFNVNNVGGKCDRRFTS